MSTVCVTASVQRVPTRNWFRLAITAGVVSGALVADPGVAAATVGRADAVPVKQWSAAVCKGFTRWEQRLQGLGSSGALADPAARKDAITKFLKGAVKATDKLTKELHSAGRPAVDHAAAIAALFARSVKSARDAFSAAARDAAQLSTADPTAFATGAQSLASQVQNVGTTLGTTLAQAATRYPASALDEAFRSTKACTANF